MRDDNRGSVLVFTSMIIIIMLILASFQIVVGFVFRDQVVVLDALDSAITASLAPAEEIIRPTFYYEKFIITKYETIDGVDFPTEYTWVNTEGGADLAGYSGNYIRLNKDKAEGNANKYFKRYLDLNKMKYTISAFNFEMEYDSQRYLPVINARWYTLKSNEWWRSEFGDDGEFMFPNQLIYVRYPRWVKTKINTTLELDIPFGVGLSNMLGESKSKFLTIKRSYTSSGLKEIKVVNPPPVYGWE